MRGLAPEGGGMSLASKSQLCREGARSPAFESFPIDFRHGEVYNKT